MEEYGWRRNKACGIIASCAFIISTHQNDMQGQPVRSECRWLRGVRWITCGRPFQIEILTLTGRRFCWFLAYFPIVSKNKFWIWNDSLISRKSKSRTMEMEMEMVKDSRKCAGDSENLFSKS
jgi:hypothetical protein